MPPFTVAMVGNEATLKTPNILAAMATRDDWTVNSWQVGGSLEDLTTALAEADALVISVDAAREEAVRICVPKAPKLRLFHISVTGTEWLSPEMLPSGATACNSYGHEIGIAEYVLWGMLEADTHLSEINARFKKLDWADRYGQPGAVTRPELLGKRLGLVGYGKISQEVAKRAHAFGMNIAAVASKPRAAEAPLEWLGGPDDLDRLCAESDHLVLATSLNPSTENLIDARRLGLMKPDAVLHNVGRARVTDEEALFNALKNNQIRGAVLDVWWAYPSRTNPDQETGSLAPSQFPFHELSNVIMTPHCSANAVGTQVRRWKEVGQNLDRLARGERLKNVVLEG